MSQCVVVWCSEVQRGAVCCNVVRWVQCVAAVVRPLPPLPARHRTHTHTHTFTHTVQGLSLLRARSHTHALSLHLLSFLPSFLFPHLCPPSFACSLSSSLPLYICISRARARALSLSLSHTHTLSLHLLLLPSLLIALLPHTLHPMHTPMPTRMLISQAMHPTSSFSARTSLSASV